MPIHITYLISNSTFFKGNQKWSLPLYFPSIQFYDIWHLAFFVNITVNRYTLFLSFAFLLPGDFLLPGAFLLPSAFHFYLPSSNTLLLNEMCSSNPVNLKVYINILTITIFDIVVNINKCI